MGGMRFLASPIYKNVVLVMNSVQMGGMRFELMTFC